MEACGIDREHLRAREPGCCAHERTLLRCPVTLQESNCTREFFQTHHEFCPNSRDWLRTRIPVVRCARSRIYLEHLYAAIDLTTCGQDRYPAGGTRTWSVVIMGSLPLQIHGCWTSRPQPFLDTLPIRQRRSSQLMLTRDIRQVAGTRSRARRSRIPVSARPVLQVDLQSAAAPLAAL